MNKSLEEKEYNKCFACGVENEIGLKLKFSYENEIAICKFSLRKDFEGYPGIIHGGIISTVLDEAMAKILLNKGIPAVTIELKTKFRKSLESGKSYIVKGSIIQEKKRSVKTKAEILNLEDELVAAAEAKFFKRNDL